MFPSNCCHRQHVAKIPLKFGVFSKSQDIGVSICLLIQCFSETENMRWLWAQTRVQCENHLVSWVYTLEVYKVVVIIRSKITNPTRGPSTNWKCLRNSSDSVYIKEEISSWKGWKEGNENCLEHRTTLYEAWMKKKKYLEEKVKRRLMFISIFIQYMLYVGLMLK